MYLLAHCSGFGRWFAGLKSFLFRLIVWKGLKRLKRFLNIRWKDRKLSVDLSYLHPPTTLTRENQHKTSTLFSGISTTWTITDKCNLIQLHLKVIPTKEQTVLLWFIHRCLENAVYETWEIPYLYEARYLHLYYLVVDDLFSHPLWLSYSAIISDW